MKKLTLPITITLLLSAAYAMIRLFKPDLMAMKGAKYVLAALLVAFSIILVRAASYLLFDIVFVKRKGREAPALLRGLLSTILYAICFMLIYKLLLNSELGGFEIIATSTVVSVIIGLALQDTLGNFFAGISIHIEQPFHILDAIRIDKEIGKVEAVTWRTTSIRTNNNTLIIFPNSKVAREPLEVYPFNGLNRRVLRFPAPYQLPPQRVIPLVRETVRTLPNIAPEKIPVVRIAEFHDSSITYEILYWVKDYMLTPDIDAKIREHIWYVYRRNDIDIPYPIRHVLMEELPSTLKPQEESYEKIIEAVAIFEPLTAEERDAVVKSLVKYVYAPGEIILRHGEPGDSMFVISRGKAEVKIPQTNGNLQRLAVLEPGNFFGEMALLTGEPRNADVNALDEVEILEIRKSVLQELLNENSQLVEALSRKLAERQAELIERSRAMPEEEKRIHSETLLHRVRRFFNLHH
ncbi:MAG TPA: mechanosensitive ion channel family protein [Blastocatellia bacterium]|nr:mechanosensitive ion channel family protein [Blastocatellia bacterium]